MEAAVLLIVLVPALSLDPTSVNLDLETSVLFEPKDAKGNTSILNSVRTFLDDLQHTLNPKQKFRAKDETPKLADVLEELASVFLNLTDKEINTLSKNLYRQVKNLKINDDDGFIVRNLKQNVKNTLKGWAGNGPAEIKDCIRRYLQHDSYIMDYVMNALNNYIGEEDVELMKIKVKTITRSNNYKDLTEFVGNIVEKLFNYNKESNLVDKGGNNDVIIVGRLKGDKSIEYSGIDNVKELSDKEDNQSHIKETSKEIILNKNIEVFVRAAD